jgi:site-specific DNA recombinase
LLLRTGGSVITREANKSGKGAFMQQTQTVNAGIYCRLSVDDSNLEESESIQTQKAMLSDYCHQHHFHIVDYFVDDGFSGTNFERPEFQRMLS